MIDWLFYGDRLEPHDGIELFRKLLADHRYSNLSLHTGALSLLEKLISAKLGQLEEKEAEPSNSTEDDAEKKLGKGSIPSLCSELD